MEHTSRPSLKVKFVATRNGMELYSISKELIIKTISWERLFLNLEIEAQDENSQFSFAQIKFPKGESIGVADDKEEGRCIVEAEVPLRAKEYKDGRFIFSINMAIVDDGNFLDNGRWRLIERNDNEPGLRMCTTTYELGQRVDELCRVYSYGKYGHSYEAFFTISSADEIVIFPILNSRFVIQNDKWKDDDVISHRRNQTQKKKCLATKIKKAILQAEYNILRSFSRPGKRIMFFSQNKEYISGNLKFLDKRMKERNLDKEFKITYSFNSEKNSSGLVKEMKLVKLISKQDYILVDDYVPIFGYLRLKDTQLIQLWHAGEGFKAVGYARFGKKACPSPNGACHRNYDFAIAGADCLKSTYSEVFGIDEDKVLGLGVPRLDGLLDETVVAQKREDFYKKYASYKNRKLILFAPTFRGYLQRVAYYHYSMLDLARIYEFCGDEYIWAFKMHPFIKNKPEISEKYKDRIVDLSACNDINDLYYVTEILITDYSSAYYDFSLFDKPILFYTYDRIPYEIIRGVQKSVKDTAPGKVCDSFDELIDALENKDYEFEKTKNYKQDNFGEYDDHASDRIIDMILNKEKIT